MRVPLAESWIFGADLAEFGSLLEEVDFVVVAEQREGGCQAANAGAGDQDAGHGVAPFGRCSVWVSRWARMIVGPVGA